MYCKLIQQKYMSIKRFLTCSVAVVRCEGIAKYQHSSSDEQKINNLNIHCVSFEVGRTLCDLIR